MKNMEDYERRLYRVMASQLVVEVLAEHRADELAWEDGEDRVLDTLGTLASKEEQAATEDDRDERPEQAFDLAEQLLVKLCAKARKARKHLDPEFGIECWDVEGTWPTQNEFFGRVRP